MGETQEECGGVGILGCFLGVFDNAKKSEGSRSYMFAMQVHTVLDDGNDHWLDAHSSYECDGLRRRRWFSTDDARPLLKTISPAILEAFLKVPSKHLADPLWRSPPMSRPRILLLNAAETL